MSESLFTNPQKCADDIAEWQKEWTELGADCPAPPDPDNLQSLIFEQHSRNHRLWREEDTARSPDAPDSIIAAVKRKIDRLNQERNDLIERINDSIMEELIRTNVKPASNAPFNSETPGSIIDRMSIMTLKIFYMGEQADRKDVDKEHIQKCLAKQATLKEQKSDLRTALAKLLSDIFAGRKEMKLYRQFKMYNDPNLNPAIYEAKK